MTGQMQPPRAERRFLGQPLTRAGVLLSVLVLGALVSAWAFHVEIMIGSGVLVATNPWTHSILLCSLHGCYALSPL